MRINLSFAGEPWSHRSCPVHPQSDLLLSSSTGAASSLSPPKFILRCFFTIPTLILLWWCYNAVVWVLHTVYMHIYMPPGKQDHSSCDEKNMFTFRLLIHRCEKGLSTIELGDVLQILGSQAVVERVPSRTLVIWPHHWVAGRGVSKAQCMAKLMEQHCEQISAFSGWEERQREEGNAEWIRRCRGVQFLCW